MPQTVLDKIDLTIINSLSVDCRIPYRNIASTVGITPNAVKERINKMTSNGIIQNFVVRVNPVIFGYEKECILTVRHTDKTIKEEDIVNRLNLLGDVFVFAKQLGLASIFVLSVKAGGEDKIGLMVNLLKPAVIVEDSMFVTYKPISMKIHSSDFKIIKSLLSNPRMQVENIAKESSISTKTVTRRLQKMRESHVLQFSILRNMSSMQLVGYIEFAVIIHVQRSLYQNIIERIYHEMQEYLVFIQNPNQNEVIFAVFFCANIPTVDLISKRLESYDGVERTEVFITTKLVYYQEWLKREINRRLSESEELVTRKRRLAAQS